MRATARTFAVSGRYFGRHIHPYEDTVSQAPRKCTDTARPIVRRMPPAASLRAEKLPISPFSSLYRFHK